MKTSLEWLRIDGDKVIFEIPPTEAISVEELPKVVDEVFRYFSSNKVELVRITGRGSIWLYSAVVHVIAHLVKAVAVYDAINNVYVIVVSHHPSYRIGQRLTP